MVTYDQLPLLGTTSVGTTLHTALELGPGTAMPISQGTGQSNRVGNKIRTVSNTLRFQFRMADYNAATNSPAMPWTVAWFIGYQKNTPLNQPDTVFPFFWQDGNGAFGPTGAVADMLFTVNSDYWTVFKRGKFMLGHSSYAPPSTTGVGPETMYYANNDLSMVKNLSINLTKYTIKNVRFNDGTGTPTTRSIFMWFFVYPIDGGPTLPTQATPIIFDAVNRYFYKDI